MIQKGDAGLEIDKERYKRNILLPEVGEEGPVSYTHLDVYKRQTYKIS